MTSLTLPLTPEELAELQRRAASAGTDLTSLILEAVEERLEQRAGSASEVLPYEEWNRDFRGWIGRQKSRNPLFDDSRDSIYD